MVISLLLNILRWAPNTLSGSVPCGLKGDCIGILLLGWSHTLASVFIFRHLNGHFRGVLGCAADITFCWSIHIPFKQLLVVVEESVLVVKVECFLGKNGLHIRSRQLVFRVHVGYELGLLAILGFEPTTGLVGNFLPRSSGSGTLLWYISGSVVAKMGVGHRVDLLALKKSKQRVLA